MRKFVFGILILFLLTSVLSACTYNDTDDVAQSKRTVYTAMATMYANNSKFSGESGSVSASDVTASEELINEIESIIHSALVMETVAEQIGYSSAKELPVTVDVESINETQVFRIIVTAEDAELAVQVANTIAAVAPEKIAGILDDVSVKVISQASAATLQTNNGAK